jgi:hypothetical protein
MTTLLLLALSCAGDPAPAGAAYQRGLRLLEEKKYDDAVTAMEEALRSEPVENPSLRYRNAEGRRRHAYHPRFVLGLARLGQAEREVSLYTKRERLQAALLLFGQTSYSEAPRRRDETARAIEDLDKVIAENEAAAVPPEVAALRAKVDRLCEASAFEEAFAEIVRGAAVLERYPKVRDTMTQATRNRQLAVLRNYETILVSRLDSISRTDPTYEAEVVLPLLTPARVPAEVMKEPEARFRWLNEFCDRYEKELDSVRSAATLETERLLASAATFDALAKSAAERGLFNGFRAARNMGHAMRMARLKELAAAAEKPDSDLPGAAEFKASTSRLLDASDDSRAKAEALLSPIAGTEDVRKYVAGELPYHKRQIEAVRGKIREVTTAYDRRVAADGVAKVSETAILTPAVMASPEECRKVSRTLSAQESQVWFESLPAAIRARTLFARAVCEATTAFLEAEPSNRVAERCRGDLLRAFGLDAAVQKSWQDQGRLSPRLAALFEQIKKQ